MRGYVSILVIAAILVVIANSSVATDPAGGSPSMVPSSGPGFGALASRGAYLARAGNCGGCHTARGGSPFSGGRPMPTPFGTVFSPNITPDDETGIGSWSSSDFWRAMHEGKGKDGRALIPVFPYESYTMIDREDADAIFAFLKSLRPVRRKNLPHSLRFPYGSAWLQSAWQALFFRPRVFRPDPARSAQWNRGAYLVQALAHCGACHGGRDWFGVGRSVADLGGGMIPGQNWYAPSLRDQSEGSVADWEIADIVRLLTAGRSRHASVMGPMAEVVFGSTQFLSEKDSEAIAIFLKSIPPLRQSRAVEGKPLNARDMALFERGRELYRQRCEDCHGQVGEGGGSAYPALDGNRAVVLSPSINVVRSILGGGFPPATAGNPRPFGMPPFGSFMNDGEIAAVATYIRNAWSNRAAPVTPLDVNRARGNLSH